MTDVEYLTPAELRVERGLRGSSGPSNEAAQRKRVRQLGRDAARNIAAAWRPEGIP